jgi:hypothetical protein
MSPHGTDRAVAEDIVGAILRVQPNSSYEVHAVEIDSCQSDCVLQSEEEPDQVDALNERQDRPRDQWEIILNAEF